MAQVPIEVAVAGEVSVPEISSAMALVNAEQDEFVFTLADEEFQSSMRMRSYSRAHVAELLDQIERLRLELRGYHPFIIAIVDARLHGEQYGNLFGDHRADKGAAVISTAHIADVIIPSDRMVAYFIYYFARYALDFLFPHHQNHEDSRNCIFDLKVNKHEITRSMRSQPFCDECRYALVSGDGAISSRQFLALNRLFTLAGRILADGFERDGRARIFIGSSSEGLDIANKLQELLSGEFSVVVWNQGTVFGLGDSTLEALEAAVLEFHSGIFVFTPDDQLNVRGQIRHVARDNVLFELGMFVGKLGRRRSFVLHPQGQRIALPSDLNGISTAQYNPNEHNLASALGAPVNRIRSALRAI